MEKGTFRAVWTISLHVLPLKRRAPFELFLCTFYLWSVVHTQLKQQNSSLVAMPVISKTHKQGNLTEYCWLYFCRFWLPGPHAQSSMKHVLEKNILMVTEPQKANYALSKHLLWAAVDISLGCTEWTNIRKPARKARQFWHSGSCAGLLLACRGHDAGKISMAEVCAHTRIEAGAFITSRQV